MLREAHSLTASTWRPLLVGAEAARVLSQAKELGLALLARPPDTYLGLGSGAAGTLLALAYLDHALPGNGFGDGSERLTDHVIATVNDVPLHP